MGELRFEHLEAKPGQTVKDVLRVGHVQLPIILMSGERKGPALLLTAGIHGSEYNAVLAALSIVADVDITELCGSLAVIPIVDTSAFRERTAYVCPLDNRNVNRVFPGSENGTASEQLAYVIMKNADRFDHFIDLHCGDLVEDVSPYAACVESGRVDVDDVSMRMAKSFGFPLVVCGAGIAGSLTSTVAKRGAPAAMAESGGRGAAEAAPVGQLSEGVRRAMRSVGLLPGPLQVLAEPMVMQGMKVVTSGGEGVFVPKVKAGQSVREGDTIGEVWTWLGDVRERVVSPFTGVSFLVRSSPPVRPGDLLFVVATPSA